MGLISHVNTKVLLIGSTSFPNDTEIPPVPNIAVNLRLLKECLIDRNIVGIPRENIITSLDETYDVVIDKLYEITEGTRKNHFTLIVYFAGHCMMNPADSKYFMLTRSSKLRHLSNGSILMEDFKGYINRSLAGRKLVILDCCHSGSLIDKLGSFQSKLQVELEDFQGLYAMASSARKEFSLFPKDHPELPTFFTGKLIDILNNGLDINAEFPSVGDIFNEIEYDFRKRNLPIPQQKNINRGQEIFLAKNVRYRTDALRNETVSENHPTRIVTEAKVELKTTISSSSGRVKKKKSSSILIIQSFLGAIFLSAILSALYAGMIETPEHKVNIDSPEVTRFWGICSCVLTLLLRWLNLPSKDDS